MADLTLNTPSGQTIDRELVIAFLNTGTSSTPVWSPLGKRVPDSSANYEWNADTTRDILGQVWGSMRNPIITQPFEPSNLDAGDPAIVKIWNMAVKDQDARALAAQDMLIVHFYAGEENTPFAERYSACMIEATGLGGEGGADLSMPINVTYGGTRTVGTAAKAQDGTITFTPA